MNKKTIRIAAIVLALATTVLVAYLNIAAPATSYTPAEPDNVSEYSIWGAVLNRIMESWLLLTLLILSVAALICVIIYRRRLNIKSDDENK